MERRYSIKLDILASVNIAIYYSLYAVSLLYDFEMLIPLMGLIGILPLIFSLNFRSELESSYKKITQHY